ncbi:ATP synthase subunit I [Salinicoccus luteus]|uniref:ATP synthase subunit I n=1 Tax=Salinicoccus luteus TaxID=367840 RepID=UPI00316AEC41
MFKVPFLRRFSHHFLKFLLFPLIISLLIYLFTSSAFAAGFALGTFASILLLSNWYYNLEKAYDSEEGKIKTGTIARLVIVIVTCLFWVRFPEVFSIFGIALGLMLSYVMILFRAIKELTK